MGNCEIRGCDKVLRSARFCSMHHARWKRHGDPNIVKVKMGPKTPKGMDTGQRVHARSRVDLATGCWEWQGFLERGYGRLYVGGTSRLAHRASYEHFVGPIPEGLTIDHLCRNRACVNPAHMEPVTAEENCRRGPAWSGNRTHCPQGHAYEGDNLLIERTTGRRRCVTCARDTKRRWKARQDARGTIA